MEDETQLLFDDLNWNAAITCLIDLVLTELGFSQMHKIGQLGMYAHLFAVFFYYLHNIFIVNATICQCFRLHPFSYFLMAQLKQSWQHWYSSIVGEFVKTSNAVSSVNHQSEIQYKYNLLVPD